MGAYWLGLASGQLIMWLYGDGTVETGLHYNLIAGGINLVILSVFLARVQMEGSRQPIDSEERTHRAF